MPTYDFLNEKDNIEFEAFFSNKEKEEFLSEHPHIRQLPPSQVNIISGSGMRNDDGWNENMARLAAANPNTPLADKVGSRSSKEVKTQKAIEKWRKARSRSLR